jgi:hypothetical protein
MVDEISQKEMIKAIYSAIPAISGLGTFLAEQENKNERFEKAADLVLGNGKPGLCENVRILTHDMGVIKLAIGIAAGAMITGIVGWVTGLLPKLFV